MSQELIEGAIELKDNGRNFWTFGESIDGILVLESLSPSLIMIESIQGSILCEEWVHTVHLEFREHYRGTKSILAPRTDTIKLEPRGIQRVPFSLPIPREKQKKYPPSFEVRYNNVGWCVKCAIGFSMVGLADLQTLQFEKRFRLCTLPLSGTSSQLELTELAQRDICWSPSLNDFQGADQMQASTKEWLKRCSLRLKLTMGRGGLAQGPVTSTEESRLQLKAELRDNHPIVLEKLNVEVIEFMHTYGKDSLQLPKPVACHELETTLNMGLTDISRYIDDVRINGLTEDFRTEWQHITHSLRLNFGCYIPEVDDHFSLSWQIPVNILSEAESMY